jgi:hypothetical protein
MEEMMNSWVELSPYWVTADRVVSEDRFELWGFVVVASADGGSASLYNKRQADAEALIGTFTALANSPTVVMFPMGVPCDRGLYVDLIANVTGVLIIGRPIFQPPD